MKRVFRPLCFVLTLVFLVSGAFAAAPLSPAFEKLGETPTLAKCALRGTPAVFSPADFDDVFGARVKKLRVDTLPEGAALSTGKKPVEAGETLDRGRLAKLTVTPSDDTERVVTFTVTNVTDKADPKAAAVTVHFLARVDLAPNTAAQSIDTYENIRVFAFLAASDPEGERLSFEITDFPAHGTLAVLSDPLGYVAYKPAPGYTGKDSFRYTVSDPYGNRSAVTTVSLRVAKPATSVFFTDLDGHWAHNDALRVSAMGLMNGEPSDGGSVLFNPDEAVNRGDFLAMALIAAGFEKRIGFVSRTGFADDEKIPLNVKSYAEYARKNGIILGKTAEDGSVLFAPDEPVSRAEAAVITGRILALPLPQTAVPTFADGASAPLWARDAFDRVTACGLFLGGGTDGLRADDVMTRAETASLLVRIEEYGNG